MSSKPALAAEGRALITVAVALTAALAVAGFIEAFVTPARMPWSIKLVVGVLAVTVLWVYTLMLGGRAASVGRTGDLTEDEAGVVLAEAG